MKIRTWLFITLFIAASISCLAQDSAFLVRTVNSLKLQPRVEKVYLHLDKPSYYPGDTIWYKAYLLTGAEHRLSGLSGVLEVELINSRDSVISRQTLKITSGLAWSEFVLPRKMPGIYHIRAYTNWMRNQGPASFYFTSIQAGGIVQSIPPKQVAAEPHIDVQFFPEGGELVSGLRSRVAFKAVNTNGAGEDIKGTIQDNDGNVIADIATQHLGMGVFALMPQAGKTYHATITTAGETSYTVNLPPVRDAGFTLSVDNRERDSIFIKIAANDKLFSGKQNSVFYLVAQSGGRVYYTTEGKLAAPTFVARVARSRFPSGITQFTLFSDGGEPINERLAFIMNDDTMKMKLTNVAGNYAPRQKVSIGIDSHPAETDSLVGSFSVSVINESRVFANESAESTILNNILMTSELKGYIEQPNYYFTDINEQKQADLDVLMLTQGYRRFEWKKVLNNTVEPIAYQPQKALVLEGTLKTPSGNPVPYGKVTFAATRDGVVTDTTTDADGNFRFDNLDVSDTAKIVLRARKQHNGSNLSIYVKQLEYPRVEKSSNEPSFNTEIRNMNLTPGMRRALIDYQLQQDEDSLRNGRQLKDVVIKGKREAKPDVYNRYGTKHELFIDIKQLKGYPSLELALNAQPILINQIEIIKRDSRYFRDKIDSIPVILDGLPVYKTDLRAIKPEEVESVGLIEGPLLVVTTKRHMGTDTTLLKEVMIRGRKTSRPDTYNNYGTTPEYDVDMKKLDREYVTIKDAIRFMVPGLSYQYEHGIGTFKYEHDIRPIQFVIDGFPRSQSAVDTYTSGEIESIRMVSATTLTPPTLIITSKNYAGTDTTSAVKLKEVTIKAKKAVKPGIANLYGTDQPYTISGERLAQYGTTIQGLQQTLPLALYRGGKFYSLRKPNSLLYVVVDDQHTTQDEISNYRPEDIEDVKILDGGAYKTLFGIGGTIGVGKDDHIYIIDITTKKYAGTDTAKTINLKQVNIKATATKKEPDLSNSANLNGPGHANQVIMGDKLDNCINLADCLNGKVFGVSFTTGGQAKSNRSLNHFGMVQVPYMRIIVDGAMLDPSASLNDVNPSDIYSIEVLRSDAYLVVYGSNAPMGALVITTRRGAGSASNYVTSTAPAGLITYPFKGYHVARIFYSPKYDHPKTETEPFDSRSTIYWNPNIITGKDGKASFEYYNADTKGTYRVVVEGINEDGKLGRVVYRYQVQ